MNIAIALAIVATVILLALALVRRSSRTSTATKSADPMRRSLGSGPPNDVLDASCDLIALARKRGAVA